MSHHRGTSRLSNYWDGAAGRNSEPTQSFAEPHFLVPVIKSDEWVRRSVIHCQVKQTNSKTAYGSNIKPVLGVRKTYHLECTCPYLGDWQRFST